jgi:hypothetical protein
MREIMINLGERGEEQPSNINNNFGPFFYKQTKWYIWWDSNPSMSARLNEGDIFIITF